MEFRINPEGNVKLRGRQLSDHDPRRKQRQTHSSDGFPWLPVLYSLGGSEQIPISKRMTVDLTLCPLVNVFPASAPTLCFFGRCCGGWAQIPAGAPTPAPAPISREPPLEDRRHLTGEEKPPSQMPTASVGYAWAYRKPTSLPGRGKGTNVLCSRTFLPWIRAR